MTLSQIAVFGANGQIGRALVQQLGERAISLGRREADLSQPETLLGLLNSMQPLDAIINAAAYTAVDQAEEDVDTAFLVNSLAPGILANYCAAKKIPFIHYSTDYVFDGLGTHKRLEIDQTAPLNLYGHTKLAGEEAVIVAEGKYLILRTSWVYDAVGKNFFNTMLRLGAERETLRVVSDQFGAPCYAPDLARATIECLEKAVAMEIFPSGIYHFSHQGETSWHGFAEAIFAAAREAGMPLQVKTVEPIPGSQYPTPAERPQNSRFDTGKLGEVFDVQLPDWRDGLASAMEAKRAGN